MWAFFGSAVYLGGRNQRGDLILSHGGFRLPMYLGWTHMNENDVVIYGGELGVGVGLQGLGAKATVYSYPISIADSVQDDTVEAEFLRVCSEIESVTSHLGAWPERPPVRGVYMRSWRLGPEAEQHTIMGLARVRGDFLKFRVTWIRDHIIDEAGGEFVKDLLRWIDFMNSR